MHRHRKQCDFTKQVLIRKFSSQTIFISCPAMMTIRINDYTLCTFFKKQNPFKRCAEFDKHLNKIFRKTKLFLNRILLTRENKKNIFDVSWLIIRPKTFSHHLKKSVSPCVITKILMLPQLVLNTE